MSSDSRRRIPCRSSLELPELAAEVRGPLDPEGSEAESVGRDAMVSDTSDRSLSRRRPLGLDMQMTVNTGPDTGPFKAIDAGTGAAVGIERGEMPEDVDGAIGPVSEMVGLFEGGIQSGRPTSFGEAALRGSLFGKNGYASCAAKDPVAHLGGVAIDRDHSTAQDPADGYRSVPPSIVVARGEDLETWETSQPFEIGLDFSMIAR